MKRQLRVTLHSDSRCPQKRDSEKTALQRKRQEFSEVKRHDVFSKHKCPTLLEEPEGDIETSVKPLDQLRVSAAVPVLCRSALRLSSATSEKTRSQTAPSVPPADKTLGHAKVSQTPRLTTEVTPVPKTFEDDDTLECVTARSMEPGSTLNSQEDDDKEDDDPCSSSSTTLSSLPSPEILRKESVETPNFSNKNELRSDNLTIKNSTLLECSRAKNIHLYQSPDISIISEPIDSSHKRKTPPKLAERKLILCKKKVWFKSPVTTEMFKSNPISPSPSAAKSTSESSGQLDPVVCKMGEISSEREMLPVTRSSAMFFDFGSDNEEQAFFHRMRKRSGKLRSLVVFPSRLDTQTPPTL